MRTKIKIAHNKFKLDNKDQKLSPLKIFLKYNLHLHDKANLIKIEDLH
jgi:hypothetical protein